MALQHESMLPYGRQSINEADIAAMLPVLRSNWLTTGPHVAGFEAEFAKFTGSREAVAVSSGTAALHAAMFAIGVGPGDEVIVPAMTFAATANCAVYQGATPVFCDVDPSTLLIDPRSVVERVTERTRAIVAVDYAGQPCDYPELRAIASRYGLTLVADACHSLGASQGNTRAGCLADLSAFSLHPVKPITAGEGGVVTTDDAALAARLRTFRNHGITTDHREREAAGSWAYEMVDLGFNYRLTDFQCALAQSQLARLPDFLRRRREIAARYDRGFSGQRLLRPLGKSPDSTHAYHLYVIRLCGRRLRGGRAAVFEALRARKIGVNVHYIPVHLHPYYRKRFHTEEGLCPAAEEAYSEVLSLPIYPDLSDEDVDRVVTSVLACVEELSI